MAKARGRVRIAACRCGQVAFEAVEEPIVGAACYCTSCRTAGEQLEALPDAPAVLEADGSTRFALYRKDRIRCIRGEGLLRAHRLTPKSTTRRVIASCCNAAMFLEFKGGHWLSVYNQRFAPDEQLPLEMRTMTKDRRPGVEFNDALPSYKTHSGRFMWRLLTAWIAMGFRAPDIDYVKGEVHGTAS
ncbi:MAG TPA: hypothetical protein VGO04_01895 [Ensifer sp.]|uniref:GFA family protein n=1 Tax=Ensifer sp. TaxID=1872086 RepID=UPI002E1323B1|nr:hypothetical protein [Ensifer sp.]